MRRVLPFALMLVLPGLAQAQETAAERTDRGVLTAFLEDNLSGAGRQIVIRGFQGALSSRASVEQLTVADDDGIWLTMNKVVLDWNRSSVLAGRVSVNELTAAEIIIDRAPVAGSGAPPPEAGGFALPELPVSVDIRRIAADSVVLGEGLLGQRVEGTITAALALSGGEGTADLTIERTDDGPDGRIVLDAGFSNATRTLMLQLDATEASGGIVSTMLNLPGAPSVELVVSGDGPLDNFAAGLDLQTDGVPRLTGEVTLKGAEDAATRFSADLSGDLAPLFAPDYAEFFGSSVSLTANGARSAAGRMELTTLDLRARSLELVGSAAVAADGLPEQFDLKGTLADPSGAPVLIPGSDGTLSVGSATLDIGYDSAEGETWRAVIDANSVVTPQGNVSALGLRGSGRISREATGMMVGGTLAATSAGLQLADPGLAQALGDRGNLTTRFWWQEGTGALNISGLTLDAGGMTAEGAGRLEGLDNAFRVSGSISAVIADMSRFATLAARPLTGRGEVSVYGKGSVLAGDFDVQATVKGQDLGLGITEVDGLLRGASQVSLDAVRDETGTELRAFSVQATSLTANGKGRVTSDNADLSLGFRFADLSVLGAAYGGSAEGTARVNGPFGKGEAALVADFAGQSIRIGIPEADRLLQGASSIQLEGGFANTVLTLKSLVVNAPKLQATASGTLAAAGSDITARVALADLGAVRPAFGGAFIADARVTGTQQNARLEMTARGTGLRFGMDVVDGLLAGETNLATSLGYDGTSVQIDRLTLANPQVNAGAKGVLSDVASDLTATVALTDLSRIRPGFGGQMSADVAFKGNSRNASLDLTGKAANLRIGQAEADRVLAGSSTVAAKVRLADGMLRIDDVRLQNPQVTASAKGRLTSTSRDIDLNARLSNLGLLLPDFPGPVTVSGTASEQGNGYVINLAGRGPGQIDGRVTGRLAQDFRSADLQVQGTGQAGLANPFLGTRVLSGPLSANLRLKGPLALSSVSGKVGLSGGRLADPSVPFSLQSINATATLAGGRAQIDATTQISTGGTVRVDGGIGLAAPYPGDLTIALIGVVLRDPNLYQIRANGDLRLTGPLTGGATIAGSMALPETELRIPSTGFGSAGSIEGLVHLYESTPVRETRRRAGQLAEAGGSGGGTSALRPFGLNIVVSAPNRLFVRGRGLDAELGGEVLISGTTANISPSGAFNLIRGRLDILGRRLVLSEASLLLEGNFDPTLRVVASTQNDGITSSVVIEGSAAEPKVTFSSSPQLPQEEVLAQLLFGRRLESLSAFQALQLANAVATLAGRGGEGLVGRLRKGFGLDDLDVQTSADGSAQLTAGKYISEKVYTEIVVDQDGKSQINLNLDLTDNVTVKGRVGADGNTGLGIFYERDY